MFLAKQGVTVKTMETVETVETASKATVEGRRFE